RLPDLSRAYRQFSTRKSAMTGARPLVYSYPLGTISAHLEALMNPRHSVKISILLLALLFLPESRPTTHAFAAQSSPVAAAGKSDRVTYIHCGTLIDEKSDAPRQDALIEMAGSKIRSVAGF